MPVAAASTEDPGATGVFFCQNARFTRNATAGWPHVRAVRVIAGKGLTVRSSHSYIVHVGNETVDALSLMDIMVQPELDGSGLGIWLNMAVFEQHPVVIEIGANPNSLGLINRLFHRLPDRKVYVAPLSFSRFLANRLHISPVANLLALPRVLDDSRVSQIEFEAELSGISDLYRDFVGAGKRKAATLSAYGNWVAETALPVLAA